MNNQVRPSFRRKAKLVLYLCLLLGAMTIVYAQKAERPLTLRDAVIKQDARTLRARKGFQFEETADKKISVVEIKTRRRVTIGDGICDGGCSSCSAIIDLDGKIRCLGCSSNPACKLSGVF